MAAGGSFWRIRGARALRECEGVGKCTKAHNSAQRQIDMDGPLVCEGVLYQSPEGLVKRKMAGVWFLVQVRRRNAIGGNGGLLWKVMREKLDFAGDWQWEIARPLRWRRND